jgi:hypothetical protein
MVFVLVDSLTNEEILSTDARVYDYLAGNQIFLAVPPALIGAPSTVEAHNPSNGQLLWAQQQVAPYLLLQVLVDAPKPLGIVFLQGSGNIQASLIRMADGVEVSDFGTDHITSPGLSVNRFVPDATHDEMFAFLGSSNSASWDLNLDSNLVGTLPQSIPVLGAAYVLSPAISPATNRLYVSPGNIQGLVVLDLTNNFTRLPDFPLPADAPYVLYNPLYSTSGAVAQIFETGGTGRSFLCVVTGPSAIQCFDELLQTSIGTLEFSSSTQAIYAANNHRILLVNTGGGYSPFEINSNNEIRVLEGFPPSINAVSVADSGTTGTGNIVFLEHVNPDGTAVITVFDLAAWKTLSSFALPYWPVAFAGGTVFFNQTP